VHERTKSQIANTNKIKKRQIASSSSAVELLLQPKSTEVPASSDSDIKFESNLVFAHIGIGISRRPG